MNDIASALYEYLLKAEHEVERFLLNDNKIDAIEAIPWVINATIAWSVLSLALNRDVYFVSTIHAVFLSAAALINLVLGHNEHEYLAFYIMTGYFISDFFLHCLKPEFYVYGLHHAITIFATYRMINQRNWNEDLFASSCWLVELSTPFLNHYKMHGGMVAGALFALSFFVFRVIWLSKLSWNGWYLAINRMEAGIILTFTLLNYYWFFELVRQGVTMMKKNKETEVQKSTISHQIPTQ